MQTMLFLVLLLYVLLHNSAIRSQQQQLCVLHNYTCPYPRTTLSNKIYGLSKGIVISPLYNNSNNCIAFNVSCPFDSYVSITHADVDVPDHETAHLFKTRYATAHCEPVDEYSSPEFRADFPGSILRYVFDAVDCLGKSLVALRLLPLLHLALHPSSNAIKSSMLSHFPPIIPVNPLDFNFNHICWLTLTIFLQPSWQKALKQRRICFFNYNSLCWFFAKILVSISLITRWVKLKISFEPWRNRSQCLPALLIDSFFSSILEHIWSTWWNSGIARLFINTLYIWEQFLSIDSHEMVSRWISLVEFV